MKGNRIAFSPDGSQLVFGYWQGPLRLFDVGERTAGRSLTAHTDTITGLTFSPDGRWLASASSSHGQKWEPLKKDRSIRLWNFAKGKPTCCWAQGWEKTTYLSFLADNQHLLTFHDPHDEACLNLWSVEADESSANWSLPGATAVAVWSKAEADQTVTGLIVTGHKDGTIKLWDLANVLPAPGIRSFLKDPTASGSGARSKQVVSSKSSDEVDEYFS